MVKVEGDDKRNRDVGLFELAEKGRPRGESSLKIKCTQEFYSLNGNLG